MGQLLVRSVDEQLIMTLKQRAARAGRSVESEHRAILEAALRPDVEDLRQPQRVFARVRPSRPPTAPI